MRAQFSTQYTRFARKSSRHGIGFLAAVAAGVLLMPSAGDRRADARSGATQQTVRAAAVDTWADIAFYWFQFLLQHLNENPPPTLDPKPSPQTWAVTLNKTYADAGIQHDLTPAQTAAMLAATLGLDAHLRLEPERLGAPLQDVTLGTLRSIYIDLGGDPDDLGG